MGVRGCCLTPLMWRTAPNRGEFSNLNVSSAVAEALCLMVTWDPCSTLSAVCVCVCLGGGSSLAGMFRMARVLWQ